MLKKAYDRIQLIVNSRIVLFLTAPCVVQAAVVAICVLLFRHVFEGAIP